MGKPMNLWTQVIIYFTKQEISHSFYLTQPNVRWLRWFGLVLPLVAVVVRPPGPFAAWTPGAGAHQLPVSWCLILLSRIDMPGYAHFDLVAGLEHLKFSHILGIIIPIDFHIFQRGSNHQPVTVFCFGSLSLSFPKVCYHIVPNFTCQCWHGIHSSMI